MAGRRAAALAALALLGASCSSTESLRLDAAHSGSGATAPGVGSTPEDVSSNDGNAPGDGIANPGAPAAKSGATKSAPGALGAGQSRTEMTGTFLPAPKGTRGVTDKYIEIGLAYSDAQARSAAVAAVSGFGADEQGDQRGAGTAVVDYINAHGGIAGRKIKPVWHFNDVSQMLTASGRDSEAQKGCADWTEDHRVFLMAPSFNYTSDLILECAIRTRTPFVNVSTLPPTTPPVSQSKLDGPLHDFYYSPNTMVTDRRETAVTGGLLDAGFFPARARVGLMTFDHAEIKRGVENGTKRLLADRSITVVSEVHYPDQIESAWQSYVLQFQAADVTHVVFSTLVGGVFPAYFFMKAAENQGYYPSYGLGTDLSYGTLRTLGITDRTLRNVQGMGWIPGIDEFDASFQSSTSELCADLLTKAGYDRVSGEPYCESLFFIQGVLARATELSVDGFAAAVASLDTAHATVRNIGGATRFGRGRHDGVHLVKHVVWNDSSKTFVYKGEPKSIR